MGSEQMQATGVESAETLDVAEGLKETHATRVEIYVADHCMVCEYAYEVADTIRADFPEVDLEIVNFEDPSQQIPDLVFATPTYLLDGRLWSLGNPSPEDVQNRLSQAVGKRRSDS